MILKSLIVDDEYPARQELRYLLEQFEDIEIVGEAAGATEALRLIQGLEYDVLFLDINLPGMNGLELTAKFKELRKKPKVIFITAYDNYAVDAFAVDAVDYILKPISQSRLKQAIDKVIDKKCKEDEGDVSEDSYETNTETREFLTTRIIAEARGRLILVDINDIYFAFTEGDTVFIKTYEEKMIIRSTLKELEGRLTQEYFFRSHRSYIVNIHKVKEIQPFFNGTYILVLKDKEQSEVPVSRNQAKRLRNQLGY